MFLRTKIFSKHLLAIIIVLSVFVPFSPQGSMFLKHGLFGLNIAQATDAETCAPVLVQNYKCEGNAAALIRCQMLIATCRAGLPTGDITNTSGAVDQQGKINAIIGRFVNPLLALLGALFMVLVIYAGYLWMTAMGNEEKSKKGAEIIKWAVIGLAAVAASYVLVNFVIGVLITNALKTP